MMNNILEEIKLALQDDNLRDRTDRLEVLYPQVDNLELKSILSNELGINYRDLGEYEKAVKYYNLAVENAKKNKMSDNEIGVCLINLAEGYRLKGDYEICKQKLDEAGKYISSEDGFFYASLLNYYGHYYLAINELENSLAGYKKSVEIIEKDPSNAIYLATGYSNIANVYNRLEDYENSANIFQKAKKIYDDGLLDKNSYYYKMMSSYILTLINLQDERASEYFDELTKYFEDEDISLDDKARLDIDKIKSLLEKNKNE